MSKQSTTVIVDVQQLQPLYTSLGLGDIPAGTVPATGVAAIEAALKKALQASWPANFAAYVPYQTNDGMMGPWQDNVAGTAPACVVQELTSDFNSWNLPVDSNTINQMAQQITQNIADNGGQPGTFYGNHPLNSSETLDWGVSYATAVIVNSPMEQGILFAFSAALNVQI